MPALQPGPPQAGGIGRGPNGELHFPPVTREHILHCSYDDWFPKYRTSCIRSRIIPLTPEFLAYIREDGIILADDDAPGSKFSSSEPPNTSSTSDDDDDWEPTVPSTHSYRPPSDLDSDSDSDSPPAPPKLPPNQRFPALHAQITSTIASLGGAVAPKLNWSSPKDATWISRHPNTMKCTSANDIYLLLKSSSFISHDLDHAFDDTVPATTNPPAFQPVLVLRAFFSPLPSFEFRCFVKDRALVAITQRDLNHYAFLQSLRAAVVARVRDLFQTLRFSFPDGSFVFDVYIPGTEGVDGDEYDSDQDDDGDRLGRARLIDINPWAPRTDTLLFDWGELLTMQVARPLLGGCAEEFVRLRIRNRAAVGAGDEATTTEEEDDDEEEHEPELRIVEHDDPAAYNFSSPQYSAHKLPKDVVDASLGGHGGIREFAARWQRIVEGKGDQT
ncbi:D123-domain-containing protein [Schizothecium vesticola]|uniref:D123-domain-containing protein n=1 Tax=Schizothecium vesticola TaxID=314040 RepID=A0AA40KBM2_9PEZI|nr:D123-domain-containing protein [Schizothecium vesticola]